MYISSENSPIFTFKIHKFDWQTGLSALPGSFEPDLQACLNRLLSLYSRRSQFHEHTETGLHYYGWIEIYLHLNYWLCLLFHPELDINFIQWVPDLSRY